MQREEDCPPLVREIYTELLEVACDKTPIDDPRWVRKVAQWAEELERSKAALALVDKNFARLAAAHRATTERDARIAALTKASQEQISTFQQALGNRNAQIAILAREVGERDARVQQLERALCLRDDALETRKPAMAHADASADALASGAAGFDGQTPHRQQEIRNSGENIPRRTEC